MNRRLAKETFLGLILLLSLSAVAPASTIRQREGWIVINTRQSFASLLEQLDAAVKTEKMSAVTSASASEGAKAAGISIPGNRIIGVFRNDFARRMLSSSIASGIEAPIRFYVTEMTDSIATLSYKRPSIVFAPCLDEGGNALKLLAAELDDVFARIADRATNGK